TMGLTGEALKDTTADVQALTNRFSVDRREVINSGNAMAKEFGISAKESMGILENALIATNGAIDLDQFKEYSTQMRAVGMNADQMGGLITKAFKDGVYQDKAIDSIKEANLRLKEMPKATADAVQGLGLDVNKLQKGLQSGTLSTLDAVKMVSEQMGAVDTQARQTAIADIFGGAGEDAGEKFLLSLAKTEFSLNKMIDLQDPYIKKQKERLNLEKELSKKIQAFSGDFNKVSQVFEVAWMKAK
ncbi:phage tail tape measure protein, partial [Flammeovirga sp. OC4]|uniref:phage tail tape measure protein n=1 Tax=Flammeovirga sp. OC4 TaxID=1382345 RepID=UPI0005C6BCF6